jgi:SAM-dependent methyltransferase
MRLLITPVVVYARASTWLRRVATAGEQLAGGLLAQALTSDEKARLTGRLYDVSPLNRGLGLYPWERAWLQARLPAPPAHLLVGGCGAGREVRALIELGYAVDAFDPAPGLVKLAQRRGCVRARPCTYEELAATVLDGADGVAAAFAVERYDAVLMGWDSLSHVLLSTAQQRVLRALDRLCPQGPLLASFWLVADDDRPPPSRAAGWGRALGRRVAALRGLPDASSACESFVIDAGFLHRFSRGEIAVLAAAIDREAVWDESANAYPHVTFCRRK